MDPIELLTVESHFGVGPGVLVFPHFSVPKDNWHDRTAAVVVVRPDGTQFKTRATFGVVHFNIVGQASLDQRWRVVVGLPACEVDEVPVGSKILVSQEIRDELLPQTVA